jgi:hypothetical protein
MEWLNGFANAETHTNIFVAEVCLLVKDLLYFAIDEYCDPYSVQIKTATTGSYIRLIDENGIEFPAEFSEYEEDIESDGWRDPNWKPLEHYYRR